MAVVGDILKEAREAKGWSQDRLAAESGLSKGGIQAYETGRTKRPNGATLWAVSKALGFGSYEDLHAKYAGQDQKPNGHGDMIPVLSKIPASFGADGVVDGAYNFEAAIDYLSGTYREFGDPKMFGLIIDGDSMHPRYPDGSSISCSPKHWCDHGFIEGYDYAILLKNGESTIKEVHLLDGGERLELKPASTGHPTVRILSTEVEHAALVCGSYRKNTLPG